MHDVGVVKIGKIFIETTTKTKFYITAKTKYFFSFRKTFASKNILLFLRKIKTNTSTQIDFYERKRHIH